MCSFAYADFPGELPVSYGRCDGPFIRLSAARLRVCRRCELRWHLFVLELIYVMLELFTTRFFSKPVAMSKPDTPVCCALCNYVGEAVRYAGPPGPRWRHRHELPLILPIPSDYTVRGITAHAFVLCGNSGGGYKIRTREDRSHLIYSQAPLAAWVTHHVCRARAPVRSGHARRQRSGAGARARRVASGLVPQGISSSTVEFSIFVLTPISAGEVLRGRQDSNLRLPVLETGTLARLSYADLLFSCDRVVETEKGRDFTW